MSLLDIPEDKLNISIGFESNGAAYGLDPLSRDRVREKFPEARGLPLVVLSYDKEAECESLHGPHWPLVGTLLTGLTLEQINELGRLRIISWRKNQIIWEWPLRTVKNGSPARRSSRSGTAASRGRSK